LNRHKLNPVPSQIVNPPPVTQNFPPFSDGIFYFFKVNRLICGVLAVRVYRHLTMVDKRANFTKGVINMIESAYGESVRIFKEHIPHSVRAVEASATGKSIFTHDPGCLAEQRRVFCAATRPNGRIASAYRNRMKCPARAARFSRSEKFRAALAKAVLENA
jgi:hypothetical protein